MACLTDSIPWRGDFEQKLVYAPEKRPGFVAWVTAFPYGDGSIGISFDETLEAENPDFIPPRLEFAEAACRFLIAPWRAAARGSARTGCVCVLRTV